MSSIGRWRWGAWTPFLSLLAASVLAVVGGFAIDLSPLRDVQGSWGYAFASVLFAAWLAPIPLLVTLVLGIVALVVRTETAIRWCAVLGALVLLVCSILLAWFGADVLRDDNLPAGLAFGVMLVSLALLLAAPAVLVVVAAARARRAHQDGSIRA